MAQAQQVLANYTTQNNQANAQRSDTELATVETGSSYAIDAGLYRAQAAQNAAPYPAFGPQGALYYIPRQTAYPRWFVAQVSNAYLSNPKKVTGTEYVLFTQAAPGAAWKNAIEPYRLSGASVPQVAVGADGLATPVERQGTTSLAVSPGRIGQLTAASLDGPARSPIRATSPTGSTRESGAPRPPRHPSPTSTWSPRAGRCSGSRRPAGARCCSTPTPPS